LAQTIEYGIGLFGEVRDGVGELLHLFPCEVYRFVDTFEVDAFAWRVHVYHLGGTGCAYQRIQFCLDEHSVHAAAHIVHNLALPPEEPGRRRHAANQREKPSPSRILSHLPIHRHRCLYDGIFGKHLVIER
jgi:hypothetical protein